MFERQLYKQLLQTNLEIIIIINIKPPSDKSNVATGA